MKKAVLVLLIVLLGSSLSVATGEAQRPQPGATQGRPTTGREMMPVFDMRYFVGEWEIEWTPLDTPLLPGGKHTGTETIRHIEKGRHFDVTVELEGPDGRLSGKGIILVRVRALWLASDQIRGVRRRVHAAAAGPGRWRPGRLL